MFEGRRNLTGVWAAVAAGLAAALPLFALAYALRLLPELGVVIYKEQFLAFFLTLALVLTFILVPPRRRKSAEGAAPRGPESVPWYDCVLIVAALGAGGYTSFWYHVLLPEIGILTADKVLASSVGIALLLEATRRQVGWTMTTVGLAALAYAYFGHYLGGMFETRVIRFDRLMQYNFLGQGAIHGIPVFVAATIVTAFMLFGQMLFEVGGGKAISDFALAMTGGSRGGPAKVSVVASALFGSLSGSASANVATTGMVTIPMMKGAGYPAHQAGAIEAVASTGGLILPPIMAATGFIMAEFLGISYAEVAIAAALPDALFYLCIFIQVDLDASKTGKMGLGAADLPQLRPALRAVAPVAVPIAVLLYGLFGIYQSPETSAFLATAATIVVSLFVPSMRRPWRRYLKALGAAGEAVVFVVVICAIAGLLMGVLGITGLGTSLSEKMVELSGGNVWLLLVLAAFGSIVLGMGVPVTATYIILVILVGPALSRAGIPDLAAHLFVFYFGTLSFLTPPVCISVFVAAALAKADPIKTAFFAVRLAVVAYIIPFLFVFHEGLLLGGGPAAAVNAVIGSLAGVVLLSIGLVGFFVSALSPILRLVALAGGLGTLGLGISSWWLAAAGCGLIVGLYTVQRAKAPAVAGG
ncbi:MAG: TRAP transporter fused permease subunit [bacterium]